VRRDRSAPAAIGGGVMASRVLVVGASAGIGRDVALRMAELGCQVAAVGRRRERLEEVAQRAPGVTPIVADVTDPDQCQSLVTEAVAALGGLDLIVYAAGASHLVRLMDAGADDWLRILRANVMGPALVVRAALGHLVPGAVVCVLSSDSVGECYPGIVPYTASKAALEELVRGLRVEHPELRFCCLRVGVTGDTEFARDFSPELTAELFPDWIAMGRIPAQMMTSAELGTAIGDIMAVALRSPGLDVQNLVIRAPGGPMRGDAGVLFDAADQAAAQR
jgi:NAD(P)-dependent dehydrogenase (short-subunit alcohol dehydrogenase family)